MRITSVRTIPIRVPIDPPRVSSLGSFSAYDFAIVVIDTDAGLSGIGEVSTLWDGAAAVQCSLIEHVMGPSLINLDPRRITEARRRVRLMKESGRPARAAIEMALFDIAGKALNAPVYELLGGMVRDRITLSRSIHMGPADQLKRLAATYVQEGFTCLKVKVGRDIREDIRAVRTVRESAGPETMIRIDANMMWQSAKEAARNIERLAEFDLHSVEQPLRPGNVDEFCLLRTFSPVPIMADESVWGPEDAWELLRRGAVDMLNVYVAEAGGIAEAAFIFRMAEEAGIRCVIGAMPELGIGTAAAVHLGVSVAYLEDPCDASGSMYHEHDVIREEFDIRAGTIGVLPGLGLGVSLDEERVAELSRLSQSQLSPQQRRPATSPAPSMRIQNGY